MSSGRNARLPPTPTSNKNRMSTSQSAVAAVAAAFATEHNSNEHYSTLGLSNTTLDAMGPDHSSLSPHVLDNLSENERKMIIEVLNRDEQLRQREAARIM